MVKTFFFGNDKLRMSRMPAMRNFNNYDNIRAKRMMYHMNRFTKFMATSDKSVWM